MALGDHLRAYPDRVRPRGTRTVFADLIVLDRNIFAVPVNNLDETKVLLTLLQGEEVYRHRDAP